MAARAMRGRGGLLALLQLEIVNNPIDTLKCAVPALCYTAQGNLIYAALRLMDAPTFQVLYQSKTVFTCIFARACLGKRLSWMQWLAIYLLVAGTILASDVYPGRAASSPPNKHDSPTHDAKHAADVVGRLTGVAATVCSAVLSAASSVYFEKLLKAPASEDAAAAGIWLRNIQLSIFALPLSALVVLLQDRKQLQVHGLLHGFNGMVWTVVVLNGFGGLLVAATMKLVGNVEKCFATSVAIVVSAVLSVPCFGWQPTPAVVVGGVITCGATCLYALVEPPRASQPALRPPQLQGATEDEEEPLSTQGGADSGGEGAAEGAEGAEGELQSFVHGSSRASFSGRL